MKMGMARDFYANRPMGLKDPMDGRLRGSLGKTVRTKKEIEAHYSAY
jgi:hypothetical protein